MESVIEKRKNFIINFVYAVICIGLFYVFLKYCLGVLAPFIIAFVLAYALQKPIKWAKNKLHLKSHGIISFLIVLLVVAIVFGALSIVVLVLFDELKSFATYLTTQFSSVDEIMVTLENYIMGVVVRLPEGVRGTVGDYVAGAFDSLGEGQAELDLSMLSAPLSGAWSVLKSLPSTILSVVIAVVSCFFMTSDYDKVKELFLSFFSESKRKNVIKTKRTATKAISKLLKAYVTIMAITFAEMFLGLFLLKLIGVYDGSYMAIISFVTCIIDIIPVLGTGTVLLPWAIYNLIFGNFGMGIGLLVIYAAITVIRQIIEPKLVANQAGLPAIVTIMAMFIGVRIFGAFGIIILPFTVIILKLLYDEGVFGSKQSVKKEQGKENQKKLKESK